MGLVLSTWFIPWTLSLVYQWVRQNVDKYWFDFIYFLPGNSHHVQTPLHYLLFQSHAMCFSVLGMNDHLKFFWDASLQLEWWGGKKKIENCLNQCSGNPFYLYINTLIIASQPGGNITRRTFAPPWNAICDNEFCVCPMKSLWDWNSDWEISQNVKLLGRRNVSVKIKARNNPKQWKFQLKMWDWFPAFCWQSHFGKEQLV